MHGSLYGKADRMMADFSMEKKFLEDGRFIDVVNDLTDRWEREVRASGAVPIEGSRVSFECVIDDIPRDMLVIRVTGHVRI